MCSVWGVHCAARALGFGACRWFEFAFWAGASSLQSGDEEAVASGAAGGVVGGVGRVRACCLGTRCAWMAARSRRCGFGLAVRPGWRHERPYRWSQRWHDDPPIGTVVLSHDQIIYMGKRGTGSRWDESLSGLPGSQPTREKSRVVYSAY